ncbi:hypothetical protein ZIOFF_045480 [Zingiber officinale]|uniref:Uncharacterized protein n=1 Tax=Zingiber officinale TaxID=94328 RepID=A0A8J5G3W3_ZINOF|nr:hypothetical protein ZIOFF_045480 [Zingiber officinale]
MMMSPAMERSSSPAHQSSFIFDSISKMLSPPTEFRVLETSRVAPPPGSVPESSLPLTFFDMIFLYAGPVQRVFFYSFPYSTFFDMIFLYAGTALLRPELSSGP